MPIRRARPSSSWHARPVGSTRISGSSSTATAMLADAPVSATAAIDPGDARVLVVAIDPAARGTGELAVHVEGRVTGTNGKSAALVSDVAATLAPWSGLGVPLAAEVSPAI